MKKVLPYLVIIVLVVVIVCIYTRYTQLAQETVESYKLGKMNENLVLRQELLDRQVFIAQNTIADVRTPIGFDYGQKK